MKIQLLLLVVLWVHLFPVGCLLACDGDVAKELLCDSKVRVCLKLKMDKNSKKHIVGLT